MSDQPGDYASVRAIEMRLFEEVGNQLKGLASAVQTVVAETREVRERLIRIEAQNSPDKVLTLESHIRDLYERHNQAERDRAEADRLRSMARAEEERVRENAFSEYKIAIEKRMTRLEMIVAPVTLLGSALLAAAVAHFIH